MLTRLTLDDTTLDDTTLDDTITRHDDKTRLFPIANVPPSNCRTGRTFVDGRTLFSIQTGGLDVRLRFDGLITNNRTSSP